MKIHVKNLAKLANLSLTKKQAEELEKSIETVVSYMDSVKNLDVDNVPETSRVTDEVNVLRADIVKRSLTQEEALSNAKKTHNGYFVVPVIIEEAIEE